MLSGSTGVKHNIALWSRVTRPAPDLKEVSFVDREGIRLLASLLAQTVELKRCSPFLREQLRLR